MQKLKLPVVFAPLLLAACSSGSSSMYLADADLTLAKQCNEKVSHRDTAMSGTFDEGKNIFVYSTGFACVTDSTGKLIQTFQFGGDGPPIRATHRYITQSCYGLFTCQRLEKIGKFGSPVDAGTMTLTPS